MSNQLSIRHSDIQPANADVCMERAFTPPPHPTFDGDFTRETPQERKIASPLAPHIKRNVVQAVAAVRGASAEDLAQCVVTGASEKRSVIEFSHVLSSSTSLDDMARFEWSWRMKYRSMNADTWKNIQTLSVDLQLLFDATKDKKPIGWFWIPTDDNLLLLTIMHGEYVGDGIVTEKAGMTTNRQYDLKNFYNKYIKFTYRFIPLPEMSESWSVRRYTGELGGPLDPNLIQNSIYPFSDLPNIDLHIPHHFVIINTGKKLFQIYGLGEINFERDFPFL